MIRLHCCMLSPVLLLTGLATTLFMTGLIWFVQVVHYAMFADVGLDSFTAYHRKHMIRTTWVVAPVMLLEGASGVLWPLFAADGLKPLAWSALALLVIAWLSTFVAQVPRHERLRKSGLDRHCCDRLVKTNWIRTAAWTARAILLLLATWYALQ